MHEVFIDKSKWMAFAQAHNASASFNATQLNGSQSYTLAAIHLAANIPIPKSVLLDTKRAQGAFVSDHFHGLRKLYESGIDSGSWLPAILEKCRNFARIHSIDGDELIKKVIDLTEKHGRKSTICRNVRSKVARNEIADLAFKQQEAVFEPYDDDDIKI